MKLPLEFFHFPQLPPGDLKERYRGYLGEPQCTKNRSFLAGPPGEVGGPLGLQKERPEVGSPWGLSVVGIPRAQI